MAKYLLIYRMSQDGRARMSEKAVAENHQHWARWLGEGRQRGWLVDPGDGLLPEGRFVDSKHLVTDGPFVELKELVGGFSIVEAPTLDAAAEIAKGCPMIQATGAGGRVEVRPLMGFTLAR